MKTLADHARAYRTRRNKRIARMEAALREIIGVNDRNQPADDEYSIGYDQGLAAAAMIAQTALSHTA